MTKSLASKSSKYITVEKQKYLAISALQVYTITVTFIAVKRIDYWWKSRGKETTRKTKT
jgi:hypothetical protein